MKRAKRIGILTCLLSILLLVNTAIAVEKEISDKKDAEYHIKLAKEYVEKNQFNEAIEEYTKAIALKPDDASLYYERASCYKQNAQIEKAIKDYEQSVIVQFNVAGPSFTKLNQEDFENTPEKAQKLKERFMAQNSETKAILNLISLIDLYEQENRLEDAIKFCSKVIPLRPKTGSLYIIRAGVYEKLKQYDRAVKDYTKAIELNPDNESNYFLRGVVYEMMGQNREAKADYQKACDLKKDSCNILTEFERKLAEIEKWQPLGKSGIKSFFYDKTSIRKQPNGHIRVWLKTTVDDVSAYIEEHKKKYQKTEGYENYSHSLVAWEIDCDSASLGVISHIDYDDKGNVLYSYHEDEKLIKMEPAVPGSLGDALYKIICKEER